MLRPGLPQAVRLQEWWAQGGNAQSLTAMSQIGTMGGARVAMGKVVDLSALRDVQLHDQPDIFTVYCRLASVQTRKQGEVHPFTFQSCMEIKENNRPCNRKLDSDGFCVICNKAGRAGPRFNLRCHFSDCVDTAWLTTFHEPAQGIVCMTAEEARAI